MNCSVAGNSCLFMSDSQKITAKLTIQTFVLSVYFTQLISVVSEKKQMSSYYEKNYFCNCIFFCGVLRIIDFKINKWNLGIGGGYAYLAGSTSFVLRGVYHGNSWEWDPMKAGWTIGTDWHTYSQDGSISAILAMLPRFVLGVNCQLK